MLCLSRERGQRIIIGDGDNKITIFVAETRSDKVRLGIEAPAGMPIHREEVYLDIKARGGDLLRKVTNDRS